jgi:hypothetical protein
MAWFRMDDKFASHPKVLAAGNAAVGLWARCGTFASDQLTDGHVPGELASMYGKASEVRRLVAAGLWHQHGHTCDHEHCGPVAKGDYLIHDYLDYNPSRLEVLAERAAAAERQKRAREAAKSQRESRRDIHRDSSRESQGSSTVSHGPPDPTRPESSSNSQDPPNPPARPGGRCAKHGDKPAPNCRGCGTNRRAVQAAADAPPPRPTWCGSCDETTRLVDVHDDVTGAEALARCPDCHPLAAGVPA